MLAIILFRIVKKVMLVLLIGWTPKPPPDTEKRLSHLETAVNRHQSKLYRAEKETEVDAEPLVTVPNPLAEIESAFHIATAPGPRHSDGTPVQHGDSFH